jgi:5-methylcytosine-specific restriction endonuclease McrA
MKRTPISKRTQLEIWVRDKWTCRYCGKCVIFAPTFKLLDELSPLHGYYDSHGNESKMNSLFARSWASIDHVIPHSKGGSDTNDNFVTACWRCNNIINDKTKLQGKPSVRPIDKEPNLNWDGLSSVYLKLSKKKDAWTKLIEELISQ